MTRIITIGGGPAAVSFCLQMIDQYEQQSFKQPLELLVLEKGPRIGPGLPYSEWNDKCILNVHKDKMEPIFGTRGRFSAWLKLQKDAPQDTNFPPRHFFGEYLEFQAKKLQIDAAKKGISIIYKTHCEVLDVEYQGETVHVSTSRGNYCGNYMVLCTGTMPSSSYRHLIGKKGYFHSPYDEKLKEFNKRSDVTVIGTRLTGIDTVLKLLSAGHLGKVTMVSRSGLLPAVASKSIPDYPLRHLTAKNFYRLTQGGAHPLALRDLAELSFQEINEAEGWEMLPDHIVRSYKEMPPEAWLLQQIAKAEEGPKPWQRVLLASYPLIPSVWGMLSMEDKKKVLKCRSTYLTYLASFPLENAHKLREKLQTKQLHIQGGMTNITERGEGGFLISFEDRKPLTTEYIINATGPGFDPRHIQPYRQMIEKGLLQPHELAGIAIDSKTFQAVSPKMGKHARIYAVGGVTAGDCFPTEHMTRVAEQTSIVAKGIMSQLHLKASAYRPLMGARGIAAFTFFTGFAAMYRSHHVQAENNNPKQSKRIV